MNAGITHCRSSSEYVRHGLKADYILFGGIVAQSVCLCHLGISCVKCLCSRQNASIDK